MTSLGIARLSRAAPEHRNSAGSFTDLVVRGLTAAAEGDVAADVDRLAIVEACRGLWRRALSACMVTPDRAAAVLDRNTLALIADEILSSSGSYVGVLDVDQAGAMRLDAASNWNVYGESPDRRQWRYDAFLATPTGGYLTRRVGAEAVLHVQWRRNARQPWYSAGPWSASSTTSTLAARVERSLGREVNAPVGTAIPIPTNMPDDAQDALEAALAGLKGGVALVPTTAGGGGVGMHDAPRSDWRAQRIGPSPPAEVCDLRTATADDLVAAAGIPNALVRAKSDGTLAREAYRQWVQVAVRPMVDEIASLASDLLEVDVAISTEPLAGADIASRARAYRALIGKEGGLDPVDARKVVGL